MKFFNVVAWASSIIAVLIMAIGGVALITGKNLLSVRHEANFFIVANSFFLLAIVCLLAKQGCCCKKE
jgi:hypothetical protein